MTQPHNDPDSGGNQLVVTERALLTFLRALEDAQQTILFQDVPAAQRRLQAAAGKSLDEARRSTAGAADNPSTVLLGEVVELLHSAYSMFCVQRAWPDYAMAYLSSRTQQVRALERLYAARSTFSIVAGYFSLPGAALIEEPAPVPDGLGITHHNDPSEGGRYSLYVPEHYDPGQALPLVVCLHGSHGRGDEYLWTWLRTGRSRGAVVLSPKSGGLTWSIGQPGIDGDAILRMIDTTCARFAIDADRILLTGLSDGGTFAYLLGLEHADRFAACAPVAGVLSPAAERLLRARQGRELPLHVVHGALDSIFPVQTIRQTNALLESLDYELTYTELPDWGHALTNSINESIVMPWFESLHG